MVLSKNKICILRTFFVKFDLRAGSLVQELLRVLKLFGAYLMALAISLPFNGEK